VVLIQMDGFSVVFACEVGGASHAPVQLLIISSRGLRPRYEDVVRMYPGRVQLIARHMQANSTSPSSCIQPCLSDEVTLSMALRKNAHHPSPDSTMAGEEEAQIYIISTDDTPQFRKPALLLSSNTKFRKRELPPKTLHNARHHDRGIGEAGRVPIRPQRPRQVRAEYEEVFWLRR